MKVTNAPAAGVLARAAILFAALSALCLLLAGCGGAAPRASQASVAAASATTAASTTTASTTAASTTTAGRSPGSVFGRVLSNPEVAVAGGRLYVAWQVNQPGARIARFELAQAGQASGAVRATRLLPAGDLGPPLVAGGWLWITVSATASERLLRMNPVSLAVTADVTISGRSYQGFTGLGNDLAAAGGALWATSGGRLLRVSPRTGRVTAVISLPGANTSGAGASADGRILIVSEARDGVGAVQRRDPVTGALIASHPMLGVAAPRIGGIVDSGAWVAEPTGMMGYIERFSVTAMAPDPATQAEGTNGISVRVAGRLVWISQQGSPARDYCADPVTGRALRRVPLPQPDQDYVTAVTERYAYYLAPAGSGTGFYLRRLGVPAACLVG
jgi:hypothetical protein